MFIKNKAFDIREILERDEREEFYMFCDSASSEFAKYNRLEKLLLFLKYNQGCGRRKIADKTGLAEFTIRRFFNAMQSKDTFALPKAKNKYEIR